MKCQSGYDHQMYEDEIVETYIKPATLIATDYITLATDGTLVIHKGYAWDGATFFPDIRSIMTGSAIHDALYQLMRMGLLPQSWRKDADKELIKQAKKDGMWAVTRWAVYKAVRLFAGNAILKKNAKKVLTFP